MFEQTIDAYALPRRATERTAAQLYINLQTFSPVLISPLVCEYTRTLFAFESYVIQHVLYHIYDSNVFEFVSAMRTQSVATALPLVDTALARKHFALTTTDHILH